jgi:hypothetical protein
MRYSGSTTNSSETIEGADGIKGGQENIAQAAKMLLKAIQQADEIISSCNETFSANIYKIGRKVPTDTVVAGIYTAHKLIQATGCRDEFLTKRKISVHGNTKNPLYPVFQAFVRTAHPWLQDSICKYAAVAALADHRGIPAEEFPAWLKNNPVEKACAEYRCLVRERNKSRNDEQKSDDFLIDPRKEPEKAPIREATPVTHGYVGLKLAAVDFVIDGSGQFRVLAVLPHDRDAVMRIVETAAKKAT